MHYIGVRFTTQLQALELSGTDFGRRWIRQASELIDAGNVFRRLGDWPRNDLCIEALPGAQIRLALDNLAITNNGGDMRAAASDSTTEPTATTPLSIIALLRVV